MSDQGFVTKGSEAYFAEREQRLNSKIGEAKTAIDAIEAKVRDEIAEITAKRDKIREHLQGFVTARNALVERRENAASLIADIQGVIAICDTELPALDAMLDELEGGYRTEDSRLEGAETSRHRQLRKHERKKTRFELRAARLQLRKNLFFGSTEPTTETT